MNKPSLLAFQTKKHEKPAVVQHYISKKQENMKKTGTRVKKLKNTRFDTPPKFKNC